MSVYSPRTITSELPNPGDVFTVDPRYGKASDDSHHANRPYFDVPPPHAVAKSHQKIPGRAVYRTISSIVGFKERFSLLVFIIFGGALIGFSLFGARTMNFALMKKYAPAGQWFWFNQKTFKANYAIHIYTAVSLPEVGGIFSVFQFLPAIRRRAVIVHRLNGYFVIILLIPSNVCGAIIGYRGFGGEINSQSMYYTLGILSAGCLLIGLSNVKKNTREHRKWMLRGVVIFSVVITTRLIVLAAREIVTDIGNYHSVFRCDELRSVLTNITTVELQFPACAGNDVDLSRTFVPVNADTHGDKLHDIAATRVVQGMALWFALIIHVFGCEAYLQMTEEANYQRRGFVLEPKSESTLSLNQFPNSPL